MEAVNANLTVREDEGLRAKELFENAETNVHRRTDRLFAVLMLIQWPAGIAAALWISPLTWIGTTSAINLHVWAAVFLGGAIAAMPVYLAWRFPGEALTRHVIAVAQMFASGLLIHLTGGRIETHFHIFGSLALLAFYRDWRVLASATVVVAADHFVRGMFWPQSIFGVLTASHWRWLEHAGWVVFEDIFLVISINQSRDEMRGLAQRQASLEILNANIEHTVKERTKELTREIADRRKAEEAWLESQALYHSLVEQLPAGIFRKDLAGRFVLVNSWYCNVKAMGQEKIIGRTAEEVATAEVDPQMQKLSTAGAQHHEEIIKTGKTIEIEEVSPGPDKSIRYFQVIKSPVYAADGTIAGSQGIVTEITERKKAEEKLTQVHRQLMDASRQAGMAEVATSVLHNVGNVLNSVNVSTSLITEKVKNSKVVNLSKVSGLLQANEKNLGGFFTDDPRGKQLPGYLSGLATHLAQEQEDILREAESLVKNVVHIKEIVAMQQNYAKSSGLVESLQVTELVEDALRMNSGAMTRHKVNVRRDFADLPPILTEKHKVLQILVNLIRNAKYACDESGKEDKWISLQVRNGEGRVKISVIDNGVGIPQENLTRIFNHGFTTRKEGHGFGLHSGAIAARELGGTLIAHSEGTGHGATFTLELPAKKNQTEPV